MAIDNKNFDDIRNGMKTVIHMTLLKSSDTIKIDNDISVNLEKAIFNQSIKFLKVQPKTTQMQHYTNTARLVNLYLPAQIGPFPNDIVAVMLITNLISINDVVLKSLKPLPKLDPREIIRRMFIKTLMNSHDQYKNNTDLVLTVARAIEVSCYNAAVRASKESEDPPRRHWDSVPFVDIYGTRCGMINGLLDINSSTCKAYGPVLIFQLLNGEINPDNLGDMTSKIL